MKKNKHKKAHNAYAAILRFKIYQPKVIKNKKKEQDKQKCRLKPKG